MTEFYKDEFQKFQEQFPNISISGEKGKHGGSHSLTSMGKVEMDLVINAFIKHMFGG